MKKIIKSLSIVMLVCVMSLPVTAQDAPSGANKQEQKFTSDLLEWALFQVKLLDLARTQAHGSELREFAWDVMPEYMMLGYNIAAYADSHGYTIDPEDQEAEQKIDNKILKYMNKPKTLEWNSDVAETLKDENKDGIGMLEDYGKGELKDPQLEQIRVNSLASLQAHSTIMANLKEKMKKPWKEENRPSPDMKTGKQ
jgi:hypothetical protein